MITKDEVIQLFTSDETYRIERTISTDNTDKFCEAICAFANDLPGSGKKGYLLLGVYDDGRLSGLTVDDKLQKDISSIRSSGNILPLPMMAVEKFQFPEGDVLAVEVTPSFLPPVRYRGRTFIRIGPRKDIATEEEERILTERRMSAMATFDVTPCIDASIADLDIDKFKNKYLPAAVSPEIAASDNRPVEEQLASLRLWDLKYNCPTYAGILLFAKTPTYFLPGAYIQYVEFAGTNTGSKVVDQKQLAGPLIDLLYEIDTFLDYKVIKERPEPLTLMREKTVYNYPKNAVRELCMNAIMHRDYQANMPLRVYKYSDRLVITNAGGLYGLAKPENFPKINDYRNPVVAEAMRALEFVNKFNRGIGIIEESLELNGSKPAKFDLSLMTAFEATLYDTIEIKVAEEPQESHESLLSLLTERQLQVYKMMEADSKISQKTIADALGVSKMTITRDVDRLKELGLVKRRNRGEWEVNL